MIPDYQSLMLPILRLVSDRQEHKYRDLIEKLATEFQVTDEEPNDPRADIAARVYTRNPNAYIYCKTTFTRILSLINTIHGELNGKFTTNGSLPI